MMTVSSREFNQDVSRIKKAAQNGPVFITDRGKPAHVLLTIEEYRKLAGEKPFRSLADVLASPADEEYIDFQIPSRRKVIHKPFEFD